MTLRRRVRRFAQVANQLPSIATCYRQLGNIPEGEELIPFCLAQPIRPAQVPFELQELCSEIARLQPRAALEIGTYSGGTLFLLCRLADPQATIISIDLPGGQFGGGYTFMQKAIFTKFKREGQALHLIRSDSHNLKTVEHAASVMPQRLDYLFIDGDHTYQGVKQDFELYSPFVGPGGIVVFHDIVVHASQTTCEVHRFWDEVKNSYRHREIIADSNQAWAGIGILYF